MSPFVIDSIEIWTAKAIALGYVCLSTSSLPQLTHTNDIISRYKVVIVDETETRAGANIRQRNNAKDYKKNQRNVCRHWIRNW